MSLIQTIVSALLEAGDDDSEDIDVTAFTNDAIAVKPSHWMKPVEIGQNKWWKWSPSVDRPALSVSIYPFCWHPGVVTGFGVVKIADLENGNNVFIDVQSARDGQKLVKKSGDELSVLFMRGVYNACKELDDRMKANPTRPASEMVPFAEQLFANRLMDNFYLSIR